MSQAKPVPRKLLRFHSVDMSQVKALKRGRFAAGVMKLSLKLRRTLIVRAVLVQNKKS